MKIVNQFDGLNQLGPPQVVERSGWGWEHFGVRAEGAVGHLHARKTLDYEDETHRRGFKFMVQVTDRGRGGWEDARHTDTAWVSVKLRDLNDNPPAFSRSHAHVTVQEDAAPGTVLAALTAQDPDMSPARPIKVSFFHARRHDAGANACTDGQEGVEYHVESAWDSLNVNADGEVRLWRRLDREAPGGAEGVARIIAVDHGRPPLSATATLTITVTDVNDCPPRLLPPTVVHVTESSPPTRLATLAATDLDVWEMGHGPPFNFSLAPSNPAHVKALIKLKFRQNLDSGRGGAEVWTTGSLDREEYRRLDVQVWLADAGGMSTTEVLTVVVDDINDNLMRPASKNVYLCKPRTYRILAVRAASTGAGGRCPLPCVWAVRRRNAGGVVVLRYRSLDGDRRCPCSGALRPRAHGWRGRCGGLSATPLY
ncbi:Neural-cadherin [Penaeus vannamei]|uniref:Neural-cadherin n=1 Tax=Penaeus vannamei TaxID=6689 RepID=A0A3R7MJE5_PENVA|nr:Neural-cadherin [Penaeus vannamei]